MAKINPGNERIGEAGFIMVLLVIIRCEAIKLLESQSNDGPPCDRPGQSPLSN